MVFAVVDNDDYAVTGEAASLARAPAARAG